MAAGRVHTDRIGRIQPTCEILVRPAASDRLTEKYAFGEVVDPPVLPCPNGRRLRSPPSPSSAAQEMEIPAARIEAISAFFAHSGPQPLSLGPAPFGDRSPREIPHFLF